MIDMIVDTVDLLKNGEVDATLHGIVDGEKEYEIIIDETLSEEVNSLDFVFPNALKGIDVSILLPAIRIISTDGTTVYLDDDEGHTTTMAQDSLQMGSSTAVGAFRLKAVVSGGCVDLYRISRTSTGNTMATGQLSTHSLTNDLNTNVANCRRNWKKITRFNIPLKSGSAFPIGTKILIKGVKA